MINYIRLHVSTFHKSSSEHLNLLLLTIVSFLWDSIRLYIGYTDKTFFNEQIQLVKISSIKIGKITELTFHM
jgi:hypothetical protein